MLLYQEVPYDRTVCMVSIRPSVLITSTLCSFASGTTKPGHPRDFTVKRGIVGLWLVSLRACGGRKLVEENLLLPVVNHQEA